MLLYLPKENEAISDIFTQGTRRKGHILIKANDIFLIFFNNFSDLS